MNNGDICLIEVLVKLHPKDKIWPNSTATVEVVYKKDDRELNENEELRHRVKRELNTKKNIFQIEKIKLLKIITAAK